MVYSIIQFTIQAIILAYCYQLYRNQKAKIQALKKENDVLLFEKKVIQERVSKYWHKWRTSKRELKELKEEKEKSSNVYLETATILIKRKNLSIAKLTVELTETKERLQKFARATDPKTGKFIKS